MEELFADIGRIQRKNSTAFSAGTLLSTRLSQEDSTVDGVLYWDLFDYLEPEAGRVIARRLVRLLRRGVWFSSVLERGTSLPQGTPNTRSSMRGASGYRFNKRDHCGKVRIVQTLELIQIFKGLIISDSFLLINRMREMLFRKRSVAIGTD